MKKYFRFIVVTLFFMGCIAYVIILSNSEESIGWAEVDKQGWIDSCVGIGIGDIDLCNCVLNKLQIKYTSLEEMYKNPQEMAASMRSISAECNN